jgi:hypothetical protein
MEKLYSAVLAGKNRIEVFDVQKGVKTYTLNLGNAEVINGPIVTKNKMTIVVRELSGATRGKVYNLPKGVLSYSFQISNE